MKYLNPGPQTFDATIIDAGGGGAYVEFPYNVLELYGVKGRVPITVQFDNNVHYQGSMVRMGTRCHIILILKDIRAKLKKNPGDIIHVAVTLDETKRVVSLPDFVKEAFSRNNTLKEQFNKLSYSHQREYIIWLTGAKHEETRQRRLEKFIAKLISK